MTGYSFSKVFNHKSGWYYGDFHAHTNASIDGKYSPAMVAGIARAEGLDFITITDHNTIDGFSELDEHLKILIIPGIEITLDRGHFNVFGMVEWRQWKEGICVSQKAIPLPDEYQKVSELMHQISKDGLLNSINHPRLYPWEWLYNHTDWAMFTASSSGTINFSRRMPTPILKRSNCGLTGSMLVIG